MSWVTAEHTAELKILFLQTASFLNLHDFSSNSIAEDRHTYSNVFAFMYKRVTTSRFVDSNINHV